MTGLPEAARQALGAPDVADPILPPHPEHGWTWTDVERKFLERWASEFAVHCVREAADNLNAEWQATLERRFGPGEIAESGWKCRMVLYDWNGLPIGHRQPEAEELRHALQGTTHPPAQPQGWVPVTERLPEKHVEVLICFAGQNTLASTGQYTGSDKDVEGWCYPWENRAATDSGDDPVVTHWMPLPHVPAARPQPKETT